MLITITAQNEALRVIKKCTEKYIKRIPVNPVYKRFKTLYDLKHCPIHHCKSIKESIINVKKYNECTC